MATPPFFTTPKSSMRTPRHTSIGFPLAFLICPHGPPETKWQSPQTGRGQGTSGKQGAGLHRLHLQLAFGTSTFVKAFCQPLMSKTLLSPLGQCWLLLFLL